MSTAPRLTIDLDALVKNWRIMAELSGSAETAAVIKADAYGLGIRPVAQALWQAGCRTFFTAMMEEAVIVRETANTARIFVLNGVLPETIDVAKQSSIIPVLSSMEQISMWAEQGNRNLSALHVDTGMNRLGLNMDEAEALRQKTELMELANPAMIMSHLACADEPDDPNNQAQLEKFNRMAGSYAHLQKSFANSAGITLGKQYHFDLTRPGISLYGGEAVNDIANPMNSVVTAEVRILQIRAAKKGEAVGYGATQTLKRDSKIAICSGGYADGIHRSMSGAGVPLRNVRPAGSHGVIGGYKIPVVGRLSMDLTAFDVTDVPEQILMMSHWVELFGKNIAIDDAARACGTIGYELLTSLGNRYQRTYIEPAQSQT